MTSSALRTFDRILNVFKLIMIVVGIFSPLLVYLLKHSKGKVNLSLFVFVNICVIEAIFIFALVISLRRWYRERMDKEVWENRFHSEAPPTVKAFVIQAEDVVKTRSIYRLVVCHVLMTPGREGFAYSIRYSNRFTFTNGATWFLIENGGPLPGTDRRTWLTVKQEGLKRFREVLKER